tara:strand:- start:418 stop:813 length:396 start_codon:yes stop_codon:yes gene_type:complete
MESLIRNSNQTKQGIDFTGVENGKIHPTDIDAVLEFDNEALILIEVKRKGSKLPLGQRLLLERLCDSWHTEKSIVLYATFSDAPETEDIPLNNCVIAGCYYNKKWIRVSDKPLKKALNKIGDTWNINKLSL